MQGTFLAQCPMDRGLAHKCVPWSHVYIKVSASLFDGLAAGTAGIGIF